MDHNVGFDFRFVNGEFYKVGLGPFMKDRIVDTMWISWKTYGMGENHKLFDCSHRERVGSFESDEYHSADNDVRATAELFFKMMRKIDKEV